MRRSKIVICNCTKWRTSSNQKGNKLSNKLTSEFFGWVVKITCFWLYNTPIIHKAAKKWEVKWDSVPLQLLTSLLAKTKSFICNILSEWPLQQKTFPKCQLMPNLSKKHAANFYCCPEQCSWIGGTINKSLLLYTASSLCPLLEVQTEQPIF